MSESRARVRTESDEVPRKRSRRFRPSERMRVRSSAKSSALQEFQVWRANSQQVAKLLNGLFTLVVAHEKKGSGTHIGKILGYRLGYRPDWPLQAFDFKRSMAPQVGLEPTTLRLTAECSAIELLRSVLAGQACRLNFLYQMLMVESKLVPLKRRRKSCRSSVMGS
jgi:hypothetical protein